MPAVSRRELQVAMMQPMPTKESRLARGKRAGQLAADSIIRQLRDARLEANLSQATLAKHTGWPQSRYSRMERSVQPLAVEDMYVVATLLGLRPKLELYRVEEGLRDQGSQALIARFRSILAAAWIATREAPFPTLGDLRSWDLLIRLGTVYRVGVEAETRLRDIQELVRRIRQRELHGGADHILVILSDSQHNRRHADELRSALGSAYTTSSVDLHTALRAGAPLPGSGVILL
jgi:transcriptional regulator with XRE-family HTH domain